MGKILAIDYGLKRCGIAVTDDLRMIASPLTTVEEKVLMDFVKKQVESNRVDHVVIGLPTDLKGQDTDATQHVKLFFDQLKNVFPDLAVNLYDERFTSGMASKSLVEMNMKKSKRMEKGMVDQVSAAILLQGYLESIKNQR
jgi:putative Holliday junction resolvase